MALPESDIPRLKGHPLFGSLLEFRGDRIAFQHRLVRESSPLVRARIGAFSILLASSPELVHELLVTKAGSFTKSQGLSLFARPLLGDGLLTSEQDAHKKQRKLMAPAFAPSRIAAYADEMAVRTARSVARLAEHAEIDLAEEAMTLTLDIVGKTLFDAEVSGSAATVGDALTEAMERMLRSMTSAIPMPPKIPTPNNLLYRRAIRSLDQVVYGLVRGRRDVVEDRRDVLSILLSTRDDDGTAMDDVQVRDEAMTLFLAGHETTAAALAWATYLVARHPDVRARLEEELDRVLGGRTPRYDDLERLPYVLAVVKETMRLYPPAYLLGRRAREDVVIGGYQLPAGRVVILNVAGIHRDPKAFRDPDRFDPERFLGANERSIPRYAYLPFGAGSRICIGSTFALVEAQLILATWLQRFRMTMVDPHEEVLPEPLITLRPKGGLRVRVERRAELARPLEEAS